jgi:hypothetical protein
MLSIVIPVYNEKENIRPLLEEISAPSRASGSDHGSFVCR